MVIRMVDRQRRRPNVRDNYAGRKQWVSSRLGIKPGLQVTYDGVYCVQLKVNFSADRRKRKVSSKMLDYETRFRGKRYQGSKVWALSGVAEERRS